MRFHCIYQHTHLMGVECGPAGVSCVDHMQVMCRSHAGHEIPLYISTYIPNGSWMWACSVD